MKYFFALAGACIALLQSTFELIAICTLAVGMDCFTAWRLSKRVKTLYPGSNDGKFKAAYALNTFSALLKIYALIVLAYLIDKKIVTFADLHLANIVAGAFCFVQVWSILENESSCNGSKWAKLAQKIMLDKTAKHFDIDLSDLDNEPQIKKGVTNECNDDHLNNYTDAV